MRRQGLLITGAVLMLIGLSYIALREAHEYALSLQTAQPDEDRILRQFPELKYPHAEFHGIIWFTDYDAFVFEYQPDAIDREKWEAFLQGLQAAGWELVSEEASAVYGRRIEEVTLFGVPTRSLTEIRVSAYDEGIVVGILSRPVGKDITSFEQTKYHAFLNDRLWVMLEQRVALRSEPNEQ